MSIICFDPSNDFMVVAYIDENLGVGSDGVKEDGERA
jgi:hypothetical protein